MKPSNNNQKPKRWYKKWWGIILIVIFGPPVAFIVLGIVAGMIGGVANIGKSKDTSKQTTSVRQPEKKRDPDTLNIQVSHNNVNITFVSNESKDLGNCKFRLNDKYTYSTPNRYFLNAGQTVEVGFGNFTLGDGTRFNAFATKPKYLSVTCDRKDGDNGMADIFWD